MSTGILVDFGEKAIKGSFYVLFPLFMLLILRGTLQEQFSTRCCPFAQSKNYSFYQGWQVCFESKHFGVSREVQEIVVLTRK